MLRKIWMASALLLISGNTLALDSFIASIIVQRSHIHHETHHNEIYITRSTYTHSQPIHNNNYYRSEIRHHETYVPRPTYIHLQPIHNNYYRNENQHYEQIVVHRPQRYYYSEHYEH